MPVGVFGGVGGVRRLADAVGKQLRLPPVPTVREEVRGLVDTAIRRVGQPVFSLPIENKFKMQTCHCFGGRKIRGSEGRGRLYIEMLA